jgi:hypothetical protein
VCPNSVDQWTQPGRYFFSSSRARLATTIFLSHSSNSVIMDHHRCLSKRENIGLENSTNNGPPDGNNSCITVVTYYYATHGILVVLILPSLLHRRILFGHGTGFPISVRTPTRGRWSNTSR